MITEPKLEQVYYFMQGNKILCGVLKKICGDNELFLLDSATDKNLYLMEPSNCYEYLNDLVDDSLTFIREIKELRERRGQC